MIKSGSEKGRSSSIRVAMGMGKDGDNSRADAVTRTATNTTRPIGLMYMVAFVFSWFLRAWKVYDLEKARREKQQVDTAARADIWSSYLRGFWVMQRV